MRVAPRKIAELDMTVILQVWQAWRSADQQKVVSAIAGDFVGRHSSYSG
jgi:hypothetical protein